MSKAVENGKNVLILGNKRNYIVSLEKVLLDSDFSVEFLPNSEESKNNIAKARTKQEEIINKMFN